MSNSPKTHYSKPWLSLPDQVAKLCSHGLAVPDKSAAEDFLRHVNYYRFSGYCLAFEAARHQFHHGVTFEDVEAAYYFDCRLRDNFNEALEWLEVDICTAVAYYFGNKYQAFGHLNPKNFHPKFDYKITHAKWLDKLQEESHRSNEVFVKHFKQKYHEYPDLPVWVVTETMTFGSLSRMLRAMHKIDRQQIAVQYGVTAQELGSIALHLSYVRNLCAHHSRLWDRVWSIKPNLPNGADWQPPRGPANNRVMGTLLLMSYLLKTNKACRNQTDDWRAEVKALLGNLPNTQRASGLIGTFKDWEKHPAW